ncbi:MAG: SCP-like extracellular [Magnetococcales bacterium]|nr:SCP-like extracellular [Magnetococcales bacterium]NGZ25794.1 SCP-like extracellular [Magnetococcales bacterium]
MAVFLVVLVAGCVAKPSSSGKLPPIVPNESAKDSETQQTNDMVVAHNQVRRSVGVPDLTWSPALANQAQQWANRLQGQGCKMEHSRAAKVGENLAWSSGRRLKPTDVVSMWASEAKDFDHTSGRCTPGAVCGHYTQLVWKNTQEVGCGMATCGREEIWVCNYSPPGNYTGQKPF